jgi:hypothetical protein
MNTPRMHMGGMRTQKNTSGIRAGIAVEQSMTTDITETVEETPAPEIKNIP